MIQLEVKKHTSHNTVSIKMVIKYELEKKLLAGLDQRSRTSMSDVGGRE